VVPGKNDRNGSAATFQAGILGLPAPGQARIKPCISPAVELFVVRAITSSWARANATGSISIMPPPDRPRDGVVDRLGILRGRPDIWAHEVRRPGRRLGAACDDVFVLSEQSIEITFCEPQLQLDLLDIDRIGLQCA